VLESGAVNLISLPETWGGEVGRAPAPPTGHCLPRWGFRPTA
jgi:hypothetical protein